MLLKSEEDAQVSEVYIVIYVHVWSVENQAGIR